LALGTSIGLGAAATLYLGSFFFSDAARLEQDLSARVDEVRRDVPLLQSPQRSASGKKGRKKGGLLERSIRELERARERQKMQSSAGARGGAWEEESDEEDGYFAHSRGASGAAASESGGGGGGGYGTMPVSPWQASGSGASSAHNVGAASTASSARALPTGATSRGGWGHSSSRSGSGGGSTSSSPALSPAATRGGVRA